MPSARSVLLPVAAALLLATGCGSSKSNSSTGSSGGSSSSGGLSAEAKSKATGDIPDNQAFLTYRNTSAGYSIQVPEGWARKGSGNDVTFQDKNNTVHVLVAQGAVPNAAGAKHKTTYRKLSPPNPVTSKREHLIVDRYVFSKGSKNATLDLATAVGVDNVDAYKMISRSFKWR